MYFCHPPSSAGSSYFSSFWIPAYAGMTFLTIATDGAISRNGIFSIVCKSEQQLLDYQNG